MKQAGFSPPVAREILLLSWPTMLQVLMNMVVQYVDMAMVGSLGTHATAAIGATSSVNWLVSGSISALAMGFMVHISRAHGSGDRQTVSLITEQAILTVLVYGSALTVLILSVSPFVPAWMQVKPDNRRLAAQYFFLLYAPMLLRTATMMFGRILWAVGDTKTPMLAGIAVNLLNVVGNFLLIFPTRQFHGITIPGAGLGVVGAGLASCIAFSLEGLCLCLALRRNKQVPFNMRHLRPNRSVLHTCISTAIPNMLQNFSSSLAAILFASMINSLGTVATAAHTIVNTIESSCGFDFRNVSAPMAGQAAGSNDPRAQINFRYTILTMEAVLTTVMGLLMFLFAPQLLPLFSNDPAVISLGIIILRMIAVAEPIFRLGQVMECILQGTGNTKTPFYYMTATMWLVRIVGTWLCIRFFRLGLPAAWTCMIAQYILLFILFSRYFRKHT